MEQAILAMLGITITLMLYLDRGRRADNAKNREEARADNARLREEARADNARLREEARADNAQLRTDMDTGFNRICERLDKLTAVVMDLCRRVGRLEGKAEGAADPDQ